MEKLLTFINKKGIFKLEDTLFCKISSAFFC